MFKFVLEKPGKWFKSAEKRKIAAEECYFVWLQTTDRQLD